MPATITRTIAPDEVEVEFRYARVGRGAVETSTFPTEANLTASMGEA